MIEIPLTQGKVALIDSEDWPLVRQYNWHAQKTKRSFYAVANAPGWVAGETRKKIKLHRLIMGVLEDGGAEVDHKNCDGLDNQRDNLRLGSRSQNRANSRTYKNNSSGCKGVNWNKRYGAWAVRLGIGAGKRLFLGYFTSREDAAAAYVSAATTHFGEFARAG